MTDRMRSKLALTADGVVDIARADTTPFPKKGTKVDLASISPIQAYIWRPMNPTGSRAVNSQKMVATPHNK